MEQITSNASILFRILDVNLPKSNLLWTQIWVDIVIKFLTRKDMIPSEKARAEKGSDTVGQNPEILLNMAIKSSLVKI